MSPRVLQEVGPPFCIKQKNNKFNKFHHSASNGVGVNRGKSLKSGSAGPSMDGGLGRTQGICLPMPNLVAIGQTVGVGRVPKL